MALKKSALIRMLTLLGLVVLFAGCVGLGNIPVATYQRIGDRYLIEVTGKRAAWVRRWTLRS